MNFYLIKEYVSRMKKEDINDFALKQGLILSDKELDIIFNYIKDNYKTILYGNPKEILLDIKKEVEPLTYNKIDRLSSIKYLFYFISYRVLLHIFIHLFHHLINLFL